MKTSELAREIRALGHCGDVSGKGQICTMPIGHGGWHKAVHIDPVSGGADAMRCYGMWER